MAWDPNQQGYYNQGGNGYGNYGQGGYGQFQGQYAPTPDPYNMNASASWAPPSGVPMYAPTAGTYPSAYPSQPSSTYAASYPQQGYGYNQGYDATGYAQAGYAQQPQQGSYGASNYGYVQGGLYDQSAAGSHGGQPGYAAQPQALPQAGYTQPQAFPQPGYMQPQASPQPDYQIQATPQPSVQSTPVQQPSPVQEVASVAPQTVVQIAPQTVAPQPDPQTVAPQPVPQTVVPQTVVPQTVVPQTVVPQTVAQTVAPVVAAVSPQLSSLTVPESRPSAAATPQGILPALSVQPSVASLAHYRAGAVDTDVTQPGRLFLEVVGGRNLKNMEWIGKQDPYLKMLFKAYKVRTKTHHAGGKTPVWNQTFSFELDGKDPDMLLECFDEDTGKDDFIGGGKLTISTVVDARGAEVWIPIYNKKGAQTGELGFKAKFAMFRPANLKLKLVDAKGLPIRNAGKSLSPFVIFYLDGDKANKVLAKSRVHKSGGANPTWNQDFTFKLTGREQYLDLDVWDEDLTSDDHCGNCRLRFVDLRQAAAGPQTYNLLRPGKTSSASIGLAVEFTSV